MRRRLSFAIIAAVSSVALAQIASAADLPRKAPPQAPPAAFSWTGWYVGGNVGYTWGHSDYSLDYANTGIGVPPDFSLAFPSIQAAPRAAGTGSLSPDGVIGGLQAGYNAQFGQMLLGIEADISASGLRESSTFNTTFPAGFANIYSGFPINVTTSIKNTWLATFRPRLGWALDRTLFYVTGGLAVGQVKYEQTNNWQNSFPGANGNIFDVVSISKTKAGWTVGGGVAHAFNDNWSIRAEYLYTDLGTVSSQTLTAIDPGLSPTLTAFSHAANLTTNTVRIGFDYKFSK
jgi:outer membrane immunogenic protein